MSKRPVATSVKTSLEIQDFVNNTKTISYGDLLEIGYDTIVKNDTKKLLFEYEKRLKELKTEKALIEIEMDDLFNKIEDMKKNIGSVNDFDLIPELKMKMIKTAISTYLDKKNNPEYNIVKYLDENKELIYLHSNKTNNTEDDYKKLVIEYYNKHYD
jgi:predicted  nucleic acid-binding Zn-ribbon protein